MDNRRRMMWKKPPEYAIYYTSTDGNVVTPYSTSGLEIISNTYENGVGKLLYSSAKMQVAYQQFYNCTTLKSIEIPEYISSMLGAQSFSGCTNLEQITFKSSTCSFGYNAFYNCKNLKRVYAVDQKIFYKSPSSTSTPFSYGASLYIGENLVTTLIIPDEYNDQLSYSFYGCSSIKNVIIGKNTTSVNSAFSNCPNIINVAITGQSKLAYQAFANCTSLQTITSLSTTVPTIVSSTFKGVASNGILYYPAGSDYSSWLSTSSYYLGYYGWTGQEI